MLFDILLLILFVLLIIFLWIIYTRAFGAEFVRTPKEVRKVAIKMLKLNKKDIFYDLGAGTGSLLLETSPKVKKAIGIEVDLVRFLIAYFRIKTKKAGNAKIVFGNIFKAPLKKATKIFIFLSKEANEKLGEKLAKEAKGTMKGVIVVSYKWPIKNLKITEKNKKYRLYKHKI